MLSFCLHANFPEISGGARGEAEGTGSPLFLDQTEARRAEKSFLRPPPPYLRVCTTGPPPLIWRSGSATGNNNLVQLFENRDYIYSLKLFPVFPVVCCSRNEPALLSRTDAVSSREGPRERLKSSRQDDAPILFDACPASHELYLWLMMLFSPIILAETIWSRTEIKRFLHQLRCICWSIHREQLRNGCFKIWTQHCWKHLQTLHTHSWFS